MTIPDAEDPTSEDTDPLVQQENTSSNLHAQDLHEREEGELPPEKPRKSGRRSNKEVREEATAKEKAQGKQQTIEHTIHISTRKAGNKGMEHSALGNRASSNPPQ
jgi:hypothetical protein